jgi:hypothetical protein
MTPCCLGPTFRRNILLRKLVTSYPTTRSHTPEAQSLIYLILDSMLLNYAFHLEVGSLEEDNACKDARVAVDYSKPLSQYLELGYPDQYIGWLWVRLHGSISCGDRDFSHRFSV